MVSSARLAGGLCLGRRANSRIDRIDRGKQHDHWSHHHHNNIHKQWHADEQCCRHELSDRRRHNRNNRGPDDNHCDSGYDWGCNSVYHDTIGHAEHWRGRHDGQHERSSRDNRNLRDNSSEHNNRTNRHERRSRRIDWDHGNDRHHGRDGIGKCDRRSGQHDSECSRNYYDRRSGNYRFNGSDAGQHDHASGRHDGYDDESANGNGGDDVYDGDYGNHRSDWS